MRQCGEGHPCDKPGLNVHIGGIAGEGRAGLVFDSDNPCGIETNEGGTDVAALRRIKLWSGLICYTGEPGERVMIVGHTMSRTEVGREAGPWTWDPMAPCAADVVSSSQRIKLAISSCQVPGDVIIDSDSQISMPAGFITIDALVPGADEAGAGAWEVLGTLVLAAPSTVTSTQLVVRACPPAQCWCPGGVLSEWLPLDAEEPGDRVLVRPRRARTLAVQAVGAAGPPFAPAAVNVEQRRDLTNAIGATTFGTTTQQTIDPWGSAPFLRVNPSATGVASLRWGIV